MTLTTTTRLDAGPVTRTRRSRSVAALSLTFFVVYGAYSVARQQLYLTAGYDLGIFDQAVRNYSRFRAPTVALKGVDYNIFADHFHPIIATAAPFYWIWDNPDVLLILQAALIAASVPIVYGFTRRRTSHRTALIVAAVYGLGWGVQGMVDFDFHEIAYAVPLLAAAIDALDREDDRWLLITCGLLLLVREDMGTLVAMLGLLRLMRVPRRPGVVMVAGGLAAYVVTTSYVIPHFAQGGQFAYWTFDSLGKNAPDALINLVIHPWHALTIFVTPGVKVETMALLFLPLALLPLRSRYVIVAAPLFAERFFNSRPHLWTPQFHYNVLPWLVLVLAMIDAAGRLGLWSHVRRRVALVSYLAAWPLVLTIYPGPTPPVTQRVLDGAAWHPTGHTRAQERAVAQIPRDVCVAVDDRIAPHLTGRDRTTLPGVPAPRPDFIVLDMSEAEVGYLLPAPVDVLQQAWSNGYRVDYESDPMLVLKSPHYRGPSAACAP